jgi:hypothetical protein
MIGVDRVVLNARVGEARRRRMSNIVFAAFFIVEVPESPIPDAAYANARMLE